MYTFSSSSPISEGTKIASPEGQKINFHLQLHSIRMAKAFCRVQNCPPDDLRWVCVIVMRSDANTSPDVDLHVTMRRGSLNAADTGSLDCPSCCSRGMMGKLMLKVEGGG
jgi:hypothetical protein